MYKMKRFCFLFLTLLVTCCLCDDEAGNNERVSPVQVPGGEIILNKNDPQYEVIAEESLKEYLRRTGSKKDYEVVKMESVTYQVVAGSITRIKFTAAPSICPSYVSDGEKCAVDLTRLLVCISKITEQSWTNYRRGEVNCYPK